MNLVQTGTRWWLDWNEPKYCRSVVVEAVVGMYMVKNRHSLRHLGRHKFEAVVEEVVEAAGTGTAKLHHS